MVLQAISGRKTVRLPDNCEKQCHNLRALSKIVSAMFAWCGLWNYCLTVNKYWSIYKPRSVQAEERLCINPLYDNLLIKQLIAFDKCIFVRDMDIFHGGIQFIKRMSGKIFLYMCFGDRLVFI